MAPPLRTFPSSPAPEYSSLFPVFPCGRRRSFCMDLLPRKADCFQSHPTHAHGIDPAHPSRQQARGHCISPTPVLDSDHYLITLSPSRFPAFSPAYPTKQWQSEVRSPDSQPRVLSISWAASPPGPPLLSLLCCLTFQREHIIRLTKKMAKLRRWLCGHFTISLKSAGLSFAGDVIPTDLEQPQPRPRLLGESPSQSSSGS